MADLIPAMEKALIDFSAGKVTQPVRSVIKVDPPGRISGSDAGAYSGWARPQSRNVLSVECGARNPNAHGNNFSCRSRNGHAARNHGRTANHRNENRSRLSSGDETSRVAQMQKFSRSSAAASKRTVTSKRCGWLDISKKSVCGVLQRNMRSNLRKKLARLQRQQKKQCAAQMCRNCDEVRKHRC